MLFRVRITRWLVGTKRVPPGTPGARKVTRLSKKWYADLRQPDGRVRRTPLSTNRQVAQTMAGDHLRRLARGEGGHTDPFERHRATTLAEHIKAWGEEVAQGRKGKGGGPPGAKHVGSTTLHARRVLCQLAGWSFAHEITLDGTLKALGRLGEVSRAFGRRRGARTGPRQVARHVQALRRFTRWLARR